MSFGTYMYAQLPLCIDGYGHRFSIPPQSSKVVCERCGLIRVQPVPTAAVPGAVSDV